MIFFSFQLHLYPHGQHFNQLHNFEWQSSNKECPEYSLRGSKMPPIVVLHSGYFPSCLLCHASLFYNGGRDTLLFSAHHTYLLLLELSSKFSLRDHHSLILSLKSWVGLTFTSQFQGWAHDPRQTMAVSTNICQACGERDTQCMTGLAGGHGWKLTNTFK